MNRIRISCDGSLLRRYVVIALIRTNRRIIRDEKRRNISHCRTFSTARVFHSQM